MTAPWVRWRKRLVEEPAPIALRDDRLLSPDLMASLQQMRITAPRVQRGTFAGEHRSRRRGASPEFADFKSYSPGDDIRRVDWNLYARLDTLFVRVSEVTTDLTVHIVLDSSPSMNWRSSEMLATKEHYGKQLSAVISYITLWHFDRIRVSPFATADVKPLGPLTGRTRVNDMLDYLSRDRIGDATSVAEILHRFGHLVAQPGLLVVVSDLLSDDPEPFATQLRTLVSRGWDVLVVNLLDPAEREPELAFAGAGARQPLTLLDSERGAQVLMMPGDDSSAIYREAFEPWQADMQRATGRSGASWLALTTDQPLEPTALHLLHESGLVS
jgi:uncharacterized protein (DUF58 family)